MEKERILKEKEKNKMKFKQEHSFEERKAESDRVRTKYPDRVPGKK